MEASWGASPTPEKFPQVNIHPTAIVSPQARLADDVTIGPGCWIGDDVTLGRGCVVQARAVIEGKTTLGENNFVGDGAVIGAIPQDLSFHPQTHSEVRLGNGNTIREFVTIHRGTGEGTATVVGDGCYLMTGCHLGHNVRLGNKVVIANNCLLGGYVEVGDGAVLGGGSVFHQFLRVGSLSMIRGGTRCVKDIPPYVLVFGNNLLSGINSVGLRRWGWSSEARMEIKRAFRLLFWNHLNVSQALEKSKETCWSATAAAFFDFIANSKRGICSGKRGGKPATWEDA
jgi:UDP-N-acetylglucosamine acyltransferase